MTSPKKWEEAKSVSRHFESEIRENSHQRSPLVDGDHLFERSVFVAKNDIVHPLGAADALFDFVEEPSS